MIGDGRRGGATPRDGAAALAGRLPMLAARKSLGQHFLRDPAICARIAEQAGNLAGRSVIEIGPGPGGLTAALLDSAAARVVALEIDQRAVAALAPLAAAHPGRLEILTGDARGRDLTPLAPAPRQIIANLPYNVGTDLLIGWLHQAAAFEQMLLMFQAEVAARICAAPDDDAYGRLSVLVAATASARIVMRLPPGAFSPPPSVHSAVVLLVPHAEQPSPRTLARLGRVTGAAFGQRRKMLRSSLKSLGGAALLDRAGIDPTRRAETLTLAEFLTLAALLEPAGQEG